MQTLFDIEEIKKLKARYFRSIDTCRLELLQTVLANDVHIRFDSPTEKWLRSFEQLNLVPKREPRG